MSGGEQADSERADANGQRDRARVHQDDERFDAVTPLPADDRKEPVHIRMAATQIPLRAKDGEQAAQLGSVSECLTHECQRQEHASVGISGPGDRLLEGCHRMAAAQDSQQQPTR